MIDYVSTAAAAANNKKKFLPACVCSVRGGGVGRLKIIN
jgi:hypothetical protein